MGAPRLSLVLVGLAFFSGCNGCSSPTTSTPAAAPEPNGNPTGGDETKTALLPAEEPPDGAEDEYKTDFSKHSVPYSEILSGGPPKDGIPALTDPELVTVAEADEWIEPQEPVVVVTAGGETRGYPIQVLMWHEMANDVVGGVPVLVTFCPLCNTAIVFKRELGGRRYQFGVTGRLRYSNMIMYDKQTESWWQQANGEAIAGSMTGKKLAPHPGEMVAWRDFKRDHSSARVLSRNTGHSRPYGANPYAGYDDVSRPPFLYQGPETPGVLPPVARVLALQIDGKAVAYPFKVMKKKKVANDRVGDTPVVVFWAAGTASALDAKSVAAGRDVGSANAYVARIDERDLRFEARGSGFVDSETKSTWTARGRATAGPMKGKRLVPLPSVNHFWFSWAAFMPGTRVYSE